MKRVVVVSEYLATSRAEEHVKFSVSLSRALAKQQEVRLVNVGISESEVEGGMMRGVPGTRTFLTAPLRTEIRSFAPDAVLYVPRSSATAGSFVRAYSLRRHAPHAAHGMVALISRRYRALMQPIIRRLAPDVLFVLSYRSLLHLRELSLHGVLIPGAVDETVYRPPQAGEKDALRRALGVERGSYVYLHVGRIAPQRGLERLIALAETPGASVIVAAAGGSPSQPLHYALERAGVRVVRDPDAIERYYRAADCYVFPVPGGREEFELPFSVFEALASGVPVISTPYGGLRDSLPPGDDVRYVEADGELLSVASRLRAHAATTVRSMGGFSWDRLARLILGSLER